MLCVAAAAILVAGCGKKDLPDQTIVTGDGFEITLPELEQVLRAAPPVTKEGVASARRAILDALIGQKLLAEAAEKDNLDERPDVVQQLAAMRRAILANAYIAKIGSDGEKIAESDIARYYKDHPALFGGRVQFTVDEFAVPLGSPDLLSYAKTLNDHGFDALRTMIAQRLPNLDITSRKLSSSDLPGDTNRVVAQMKPGSDVAYRTADALHLGRVASVQPAPVGLDEARDQIVAMLAQDRRTTLAKAAVDDLKRTRKVRIVNPDLAKMVAK